MAWQRFRSLATSSTACVRAVRPSPLFTRTLCSLPRGQGQNHMVHPPQPGVVEGTKTSVVFRTADRPGALEEVLRLFWKNDVNMTRIESKPDQFQDALCGFHVDFDGTLEQGNVHKLISELSAACEEVIVVDPAKVPYFPTRITDIDGFSQKTLDAGAELDSDHPGFNDQAYRDRRNMIVELAQNYKFGDELPTVDYNETEVATWGAVYDKLRGYTRKYAVEEYNAVLDLMEKDIGFHASRIPQLGEISGFLRERTGFTLRPVGGLLSARDFLNGLAFKVFFSTQYIRHHTMPLYTPEPDIVHELLGHAPMFADPDFAAFSHEIGLASLGATDEEIRKLGTCYWFSVEFGLANQGGMPKAYGAGLLSSFGELEYACSPDRPAGGTEERPELLPWDPKVAAVTDYPITTYQPKYFVAEDMDDACKKMREFCRSLNRPFNVRYDSKTESVWVDRNVARGEYSVTLQKDGM